MTESTFRPLLPSQSQQSTRSSGFLFPPNPVDNLVSIIPKSFSNRWLDKHHCTIFQNSTSSWLSSINSVSCFFSFFQVFFELIAARIVISPESLTCGFQNGQLLHETLVKTAPDDNYSNNHSKSSQWQSPRTLHTIKIRKKRNLMAIAEQL